MSSDERSAANEAVQRVVDRVVSWHETATEGTIEDELDKGLAEAGVDVDADDRQRLTSAISDADGPVSVADVLGPRG